MPRTQHRAFYEFFQQKKSNRELHARLQANFKANIRVSARRVRTFFVANALIPLVKINMCVCVCCAVCWGKKMSLSVRKTRSNHESFGLRRAWSFNGLCVGVLRMCVKISSIVCTWLKFQKLFLENLPVCKLTFSKFGV